MTQVSIDENSSDSSEKMLAKIKPKTIAATSIEGDEEAKNKEIANEKTIIEATRLLLREFGIRKSGAAIREAVETRHNYISPKEAVSALSNLGFKASFGSIKFRNLNEDFFPLIAFNKNGEAFLVKTPPNENKITLIEPISKNDIEIPIPEFKKEYSNYFVIVKQLNKREKEERSGHWFFSALERVSGSTCRLDRSYGF